MRKNLLLAIVPLMLFACGEQAAPKVEAPPLPSEPPLERGKLLESVAVAGTNGESYAAYVPSSGESLPLLLLFDSHARGAGTLEKYQELAEQEKVIVVVSNTSKNGLDANTAVAIGKRLMDAALARTPANRQVVWAGGFSGGARVASQFALAHQEVNGVIGIGAGYDPSAAQGRDLDFFGIVGLKDFNFRELIAVDSLREAQGQQGFLLLTSGGHEWPAAEIMFKAIRWQRMESIRDGNLPKEATASIDPLAEYKAWNDAFPESTALMQVMRMRYCLSAFGKLADAAPLEKELNAAAANVGVGAGLQQRQAALSWEQRSLQRLQPLIGSLPAAEWDREIQQLTNGASSRNEMGYAYQRVLNFLSLMFYMQSNGALQQGDLGAADHFLTLYAKVDPTNSEHAYLRGQYWMKKGNKDNAIAALEQAVALGFEDKARLASDPVLQALQAEPRMQAMLANMK